MKLILSGFPEALDLGSDAVSVLEIHNRTLFSRVCQSLFSELDDEALEPYAFWDDDERRSSRNQFLFVFNPFALPWSERYLSAKCFSVWRACFSLRMMCVRRLRRRDEHYPSGLPLWGCGFNRTMLLTYNGRCGSI